MTTRIRLVCTTRLYYAYVDIFKANILQSDSLTYAIYDNQEKKEKSTKITGSFGKRAESVVALSCDGIVRWEGTILLSYCPRPDGENTVTATLTSSQPQV